MPAPQPVMLPPVGLSVTGGAGPLFNWTVKMPGIILRVQCRDVGWADLWQKFTIYTITCRWAKI